MVLGSTRVLAQELHTYFSTAAPSHQTKLPKPLLASIEAYSAKHNRSNDHSGDKLQGLLQETFRRHVHGRSGCFLAFVHVLDLLAPCLYTHDRLLVWWEILSADLTNEFVDNRSLKALTVVSLLKILVPSDESVECDPRNRLLSDGLPTVRKTIQTWMGKVRLAESQVGDFRGQEEILRIILLQYAHLKPKIFLDTLNYFFSKRMYRRRAIDLLSYYLQNNPVQPILLTQFPLFPTLMKCLLTDTSTTVVSCALISLLSLLPYVGPQLPRHLPVLFLVYTRMLFWERARLRAPADVPDLRQDDWEASQFDPNIHDTHITHIDDLFTFLYALYPLTFMDFLKDPEHYHPQLEYPCDVDALDIQPYELRELTEAPRMSHLLHPHFFTHTLASEKVDFGRWLKYSPPEILSMCVALRADKPGVNLRPWPAPPDPTVHADAVHADAVHADSIHAVATHADTKHSIVTHVDAPQTHLELAKGVEGLPSDGLPHTVTDPQTSDYPERPSDDLPDTLLDSVTESAPTESDLPRPTPAHSIPNQPTSNPLPCGQPADHLDASTDLGLDSLTPTAPVPLDLLTPLSHVDPYDRSLWAPITSPLAQPLHDRAPSRKVSTRSLHPHFLETESPWLATAAALSETAQRYRRVGIMSEPSSAISDRSPHPLLSATEPTSDDRNASLTDRNLGLVDRRSLADQGLGHPGGLNPGRSTTASIVSTNTQDHDVTDSTESLHDTDTISLDQESQVSGSQSTSHVPSLESSNVDIRDLDTEVDDPDVKSTHGQDTDAEGKDHDRKELPESAVDRNPPVEVFGVYPVPVNADASVQALIARLWRQIYLLENDIRFEKHLKQQHLAHISLIRRRLVRDAAADAEAQNLHTMVRALRRQVEESKQTEAQIRKDSERGRALSKKWEGELTTRLAALREELVQIKAERDTLQQQVERHTDLVRTTLQTKAGTEAAAGSAPATSSVKTDSSEIPSEAWKPANPFPIHLDATASQPPIPGSSYLEQLLSVTRRPLSTNEMNWLRGEVQRLHTVRDAYEADKTQIWRPLEEKVTHLEREVVDLQRSLAAQTWTTQQLQAEYEQQVAQLQSQLLWAQRQKIGKSMALPASSLGQTKSLGHLGQTKPLEQGDGLGQTLEKDDHETDARETDDCGLAKDCQMTGVRDAIDSSRGDADDRHQKDGHDTDHGTEHTEQSEQTHDSTTERPDEGPSEPTDHTFTSAEPTGNGPPDDQQNVETDKVGTESSDSLTQATEASTLEAADLATPDPPVKQASDDPAALARQSSRINNQGLVTPSHQGQDSDLEARVLTLLEQRDTVGEGIREVLHASRRQKEDLQRQYDALLQKHKRLQWALLER